MEQRNRIRFGTGGWRAVIGDDFTKENVQRVTNGLLAYIREQGKTSDPVMIGYDRRFLSEPAARWTAEILASGGIKVWFLKRSAPTPLVMHTVLKKQLSFGIEITASHNPPNYNGYKLIVAEGRDAPLETTQHLEELINTLEPEQPRSFEELCESGMIRFIQNPFNDYLDDILAQIDVAALRKRGIRVLFDTMHGSGTYPLMVVFHTARCTIDAMNINKDAYFGGDMPAPGERQLRPLQNAVIRGGYDLGIALDGDGDRLGIIDEEGRYISANEILCMLYYYLLKYKGWKGGVVRNLSTTHMLDKIAESFGEQCYEVPVGFKWISSGIDEHNAVLGGESSGGLTVRGHIHGKDSVYAAALFAEMLSVTEMCPREILEQLEKQYGRFVMAEDNITLQSGQKEHLRKYLMEERKLPEFDIPVKNVSYMDGCKILFENGDFVLCRFSGTEPLLRVTAESGDKETAESYIRKFRDFLKI